MIVKIQDPNPNLRSAVEYNERKMDGVEGIRNHQDPELAGIENGHVLATRNVPEGRTLSEEFDRLTLLNLAMRKRGRQLKNVSFHMSVNPSETDKPLSEKETVNLIDEIMDGLGYKEQPYRIYKHTDIERTHYHVVSCRSGQDGKKVNSDFERLVLRKKLKELSSKYGFELVLSDDEKEEIRKAEGKTERPEEEPRLRPVEAKKTGKKKSEEDEKKDKKVSVPAFSRETREPVREQIKAIANEAMTWHFSSFEQIQALLLRRYNVLLEIERRGDGEAAVFFGTDKSGKPITPPLDENEIYVNFLRQLTEKSGKEKMYNRRDQKKRLEQLSRAAAGVSDSFDSFCTLMAKKGVIVVVSWAKDGRPFGVTYLDRATKCAWKGSETMVDLHWLIKTAQEKGWKLDKDAWQKLIEKRISMPSRKASPTEETKVTAQPGQKGKSDNGEKSQNIYLPGHHEESRARLGGMDDDIEEDKPQELVH